MGKISVYCKKKQILRLPGSIKIHLDKGVQQVDEDVVAMFPNLFHIRPESVDEKPSDADNGQIDPPADTGEGESEKDDPEGSEDDSKVDPPADDPPADPLAEAMAEVADLKDSKKALETYGRKFGIELNRRRSLANMKLDLEDALKELMQSGE